MIIIGFHFLPMKAVFEPLGLDVVEANAGLEVEAKVGLEVDWKAGLLEVEAKAGLLEVDAMAGALGSSANGLDVEETKGRAVEAKGLAVEAKGLAVEAKGLDVEAKGLAVVATGCLTGCLAGLEDSKDPPNNPLDDGLGLAVAASLEAGPRMGKPLPLNPEPCPLPAPPPKALPFLRADGGTAPDPPQAGTNQGQLHIRLTSSKANPKGHLNS